MTMNFNVASNLKQLWKWRYPQIFCGSLLALGLNLAVNHKNLTHAYPLIRVDSPTVSLIDEKLISEDKQEFLKAIDNSLKYLETAKAKEVYSQYPIPDFNRQRALSDKVRKRFKDAITL